VELLVGHKGHSIGGVIVLKERECKHLQVPVSEIELDTANPRIALWLEIYEGTPSPEQVFLALHTGGGDEDGPTFEKLRQSIITSGTVIQPVILNRTNDGGLVCIDGNTRVALYRDFIERGVAGSWQEIPAVVYSDLDDREVDAIRLQAHLVGPRQWDPYSKAKNLDHLRHQEHIPWSELVDFCGGSQRMVTELIGAYSDIEKYYRPLLSEDHQFEVRRFSGFVELQKPGIKEAIELAGHSLGDFAQWIIDRKVDALREVRLLPKILRHKEAHGVFLKAGVKEALKVLETPDLSSALQEASLPDLCRALVSSYERIAYREVQRMKEDAGSTAAVAVHEAYEALCDLENEIGAVD